MTPTASQTSDENAAATHLRSGFDDYTFTPVHLQVLARMIEQSRAYPVV